MTITSQLREFIDLHALVVPLNVEQYHRMIEQAILEEGAPIELLDGFLVRKDRAKSGEDSKTVGHHHTLVIGKLNRLSTAIEKMGCHLRIQQPITLPPDNEPEPDGAIARGSVEDYSAGHPVAKDVGCVIEVADSSLQRDQITKQRIYADHAIGHYVIVNLVESVVEDYRDPVPGTGRYAKMTTLRCGQKLALQGWQGKELEITAEMLLP